MTAEWPRRRLPIGAELLEGRGVHFRVWAPRREKVAVVIEGGPGGGRSVALEPERSGYFSGYVPQAAAGTRYRYQLGDSGAFPDPASRFQPVGPHGPSEVIDTSLFSWTDHEWRGARLEGQILYEMHIGTFTREGTWNAARHQLPELASAGITTIEMMPVADFPGNFGWGYDGVGLYAPTRLYGCTTDFWRFVNDAHALGMGVILDVVYNHVGPEGNHLRKFSVDYFTAKYKNEWGEAINFDGPNCIPVREFFISNAVYWISEYHMDGLRLDATQQIFDSSAENIIRELACRARQAAAGRTIIITAENEPQETKLLRPVDAGGFGLDAAWNDDFHHTAVVALTGRNEAYYTGYRGNPQELISAAKYGFLYQGQRYSWQGKRRGTSTRGMRPAQFVTFLENHDQIANSARGDRLSEITEPEQLRAVTALFLLGPGTPLLFQGQEFGSSAPFLFFADYGQGLARSVREGRAKFLTQFRSLDLPQMQSQLPDPCSSATFARCKLDFTERERNHCWYDLHKDLLRLRREDAVFRMQGEGGLDGAILAPEALVLRFFGEAGDDRLLLMNLGLDLHLEIAPEPLLAAPPNTRWQILWSSEDPRYGGTGVYAVETEENWRVPGHATVVLRSVTAQEQKRG